MCCYCVFTTFWLPNNSLYIIIYSLDYRHNNRGWCVYTGIKYVCTLKLLSSIFTCLFKADLTGTFTTQSPLHPRWFKLYFKVKPVRSIFTVKLSPLTPPPLCWTTTAGSSRVQVLFTMPASYSGLVRFYFVWLAWSSASSRQLEVEDEAGVLTGTQRAVQFLIFIDHDISKVTERRPERERMAESGAKNETDAAQMNWEECVYTSLLLKSGAGPQLLFAKTIQFTSAY